MVIEDIIQFLHNFSNALSTGQGVSWSAWSYPALSFLVLVEGPIVTVLGAAASAAGFMDPALVFIAAILGNLAADGLWYGVGYLGKAEWIVEHFGWLNLRPAHLQRLTADMHRHARKLLLIAKLTISISVPVLLATGIAKVPWRRWFWVVFFGEFVWTAGLVFAGYHFARSVTELELGLQIGAVLTVTAFAFLIGRYVVRLTKEWSDLPASEDDADGGIAS